MAFVSLIVTLFMIPLLCILLIVGIVLLIIGVVNKNKSKFAGRRFPRIFIGAGISLTVLPFAVALVLLSGAILSSSGNTMNEASFDSVPEHWKHASVSDNRAAEEAVNALMKAAGEGNRNAFMQNFTAEIQHNPSFASDVDRFFKTFPAGLSNCRLNGHVTGSGSSYHYGHNVKEGSAFYTCDMNGEKYFISLSFCYDNTDQPDSVGVEYFSVMNLGARALYIEKANMGSTALYIENAEPYSESDGSDTSENEPIVICDIKDSNEVDARLINGIPFVWHPADNKKLTADEMRTLLSTTNSMDELIREIGMANAAIKYDHSTGYDYYYELVSENSEPRYVHISAVSIYGKITDAYECTPEKTFYDNPIKAFKPETPPAASESD